MFAYNLIKFPDHKLFVMFLEQVRWSFHTHMPENFSMTPSAKHYPMRRLSQPISRAHNLYECLYLSLTLHKSAKAAFRNFFHIYTNGYILSEYPFYRSDFIFTFIGFLFLAIEFAAHVNKRKSISVKQISFFASCIWFPTELFASWIYITST